MRFWKINAGDEGIIQLAKYLEQNPDITLIDLLDNNITARSLEPLGKIIYVNPLKFKLKKIHLDHNNIGNKGLRVLVNGLRKSPFIEELSLSYCNLEEISANYLQQLLVFVDTNLQTLNLQGNQLKNRGCN